MPKSPQEWSAALVGGVSAAVFMRIAVVSPILTALVTMGSCLFAMVMAVLIAIMGFPRVQWRYFQGGRVVSFVRGQVEVALCDGRIAGLQGSSWVMLILSVVVGIHG